ncbi:hypothetical protein CAPTEDRAFT_194019, partial [Capitella teleta]
MDDPRIEWLRNKVHHALDISEADVFEDLLNRDDGEAERSVAKFLNETAEEAESSLIFYKVVQEEEEEVEVECEPSIPDIQPDEEGDLENAEDGEGHTEGATSPAQFQQPGDEASVSGAGNDDESKLKKVKLPPVVHKIPKMQMKKGKKGKKKKGGGTDDATEGGQLVSENTNLTTDGDAIDEGDDEMQSGPKT